MPKSSLAKRNLVPDSSRSARNLHTVLAQMAKEAEELAAQVARVRALRAAKRVTQQDVADAVDVSLRTVQSWEAEIRPADIADRNLKKLAAYYGVTPDFIEYGADEHAPSDAPEVAPLDVARVRRSLSDLEDQIRLLRAETAERDAEVLRQIGQLRRTTRQSRRPPPG